jgi:hypothetical protein
VVEMTLKNVKLNPPLKSKLPSASAWFSLSCNMNTSVSLKSLWFWYL